MSVSPQTITILHVEDDDGHASLVRKNFERAGLVNQIVRARDGEEALRLIEARNTLSSPLTGSFLLLLDLKMSKISGMEVLGRLKSSPNTTHIPVVVLTTTDDPREVARCYQLGCNVYLQKPVDYEQFIEAIRQLGLFLQLVRVP